MKFAENAEKADEEVKRRWMTDGVLKMLDHDDGKESKVSLIHVIWI